MVGWKLMKSVKKKITVWIPTGVMLTKHNEI